MFAIEQYASRKSTCIRLWTTRPNVCIGGSSADNATNIAIIDSITGPGRQYEREELEKMIARLRDTRDAEDKYKWKKIH